MRPRHLVTRRVLTSSISRVAIADLITARFETVSVAFAALDVALVGSGSGVSDLLKKHGGVDQEFGDFGDGVFESVFKKEVDEIWILEIR